MSILSKRIAERLNGARSTVEVVEWGDESAPLIIYFGPLLAGEMDRLQRKHENFLSNISFAGMIDLIIMKAEDKAGEKLFTLEDKPVLMREEMSVISKIATSIITAKSIEDHEKN